MRQIVYKWRKRFCIDPSRRVPMTSYRCVICDYIYDPALGDPGNGVPPGTAFEDLPSDWACPLCGADKSNFESA